MSLQVAIQKLSRKENLTSSEMEEAIDLFVEGHVSESEAISFLINLRDKGESADEIRGAVSALRKKETGITCHTQDILDTCGTGGTQKNTFNISTAAAFVVAGCGITVAKHGNTAISSVCGSADVLRELGVNIDASSSLITKCIDTIGIGFLFAPHFHPVLKQFAGLRKKIGTKTIFNLLGPLLNPAHVKKQVIGVYSKIYLPVVTQALKDLGSQSVAVIHGSDGTDELTLTGTTTICFLKQGKITTEIFDPKSVGYSYCSAKDLEGGKPADNAKRLRLVLKGHSLPLDHCVHLNAALAICVAGKADNFKEALLMAQESISSGKAYQKLEQLVEMTNS